jgi:hypothetical protein
MVTQAVFKPKDGLLFGWDTDSQRRTNSDTDANPDRDMSQSNAEPRADRYADRKPGRVETASFLRRVIVHENLSADDQTV